MRKITFIWLKEFIVKRFDVNFKWLVFTKLKSNKEKVVFHNSIYSFSYLQDFTKNSKTGNQPVLKQKFQFSLLKELNKFAYLLMNKFQIQYNNNLGIAFNTIKDDDTEIKYVRCKNRDRPN